MNPPSIEPALEQGLHDVSEKIYHGDPCPLPSLSCSLAKTLIDESCLHGYQQHPRLGGGEGGKESTPEMIFGTIVHRLILGKGAEVEIGPWKDWRTDDAKDFRKAVQDRGHTPTLKHTYDRAVLAAAEAMKEFDRLGYGDFIRRAQKEISGICFKDGIWMRSRYDLLDHNEESHQVMIGDLKVSARANPQTVENQIGEQNYDMAGIFYPEVMETIFPDLAGRISYMLFFIENEWPFSVVPVEFSGETRELGKMKFKRAKYLWTRCMETGRWPRYTDKPIIVFPKPWNITREAEAIVPDFGKSAAQAAAVLQAAPVTAESPVTKPAVAPDAELPFA